jgi:hypothetical protein
VVAAIAAIASRSPRARRVKAAKAAALLVAHGNRAGAMTKEALLRRCMKMALARLANAEPLLKKTQTSMQRGSDEWSIFRNDQRSGGAQFVTLMTGPQVDSTALSLPQSLSRACARSSRRFWPWCSGTVQASTSFASCSTPIVTTCSMMRRPKASET